jgi:alkanesulfonate monooxygenase SsuD/methylene tetrahydromethanopterin reductase-like flavin-dependent oxidoreductase (luciferase family)
MPDNGQARGLGIAAGIDPGIARDLAVRCADAGYKSLWSNDHPMASGLETLAEFAPAAPQQELGVAVMALDRHQPGEVASKIADLGLDPGRLWIGIGAGFASKPLAVVREGLAAMRSALPNGARIVVAAMGPKMCALAGGTADGVFLNWMTPERSSWARERVEEGAAQAGRESAPPIFGYVRVAVGNDAQERLRKEESFYRELHAGYARHFESLGREPGTVGVAAVDPAVVAAELESFDSIDHIVVRALAHADPDSLGAVADAAAPRPHS